jgi:thiamine transport system ATP-binding protein
MLSIQHLKVNLGGRDVVGDVDLELGPGEVHAVLGPSGCGKSTFLRGLAGLVPLLSGQIFCDGVDLTTCPTHKRGFALLFQDGQLFPQRDVAGNVAYAMRDLTRAQRTMRVAELLELVGLPGFQARNISTLSGGEQQRVALARALGARPRVLLLDEPLSGLDTKLRAELGQELRQIFKATSLTTIMVTHDHEEAFAVADSITVMRAGQFVQRGPIAEVWAHPADRETALFLGYASVLSGQHAQLLMEGTRLPAESTIALRRSALRVSDEGALSGLVRSVHGSPEVTRLIVEVPPFGELNAVASLGVSVATGEQVQLLLDPAKVAPVGRRLVSADESLVGL